MRSSVSSLRSVCRRVRENRLGLRVERLRLEPGSDPRDLTPYGRLALLELVERLLQVVDRDLLGDDPAEPGEPGDRLLHLRDRHTDGQRRASLLARRHRRRDDVAPERSGEVERILGRARDGVGVGHLHRQRRTDALRAIGRLVERGALRSARSRRERPPIRSAARSGALSAVALSSASWRYGWGATSERASPSTPALAKARAAAAGTATSIPRRTGNRQLAQRARAGCSAAISRTRARSSAGADGRDARSSWISSGDDVMVSHPLFELRQRTAQPGGHRRG